MNAENTKYLFDTYPILYRAHHAVAHSVRIRAW